MAGTFAFSLTSGQDLRADSRPHSRRRADCGAFSTDGNRAINRTQQRTAVDVLGGPLFLTDAVSLFDTYRRIIRCYRIRLLTQPCV